MLEQTFTIDEAGVMSALSNFAEARNENALADYSQITQINGQAIVQLLTIYKAAHEICHWVGAQKLIEILLTNYRESFRSSLNEVDLTPEGFEKKVEEVFTLQILLSSLVPMENATRKFEIILSNK